MTGIGAAVLIGKYSAGATLGCLIIVYGMNEFLSATGYSWYRFAAYQGSGIVITFIGWMVLLTTLVNLYGELKDK
ncbi:hypothetical protein [Natronorubrum aibiense]|uniref:Uncharacterized protein n=1 Tax=Natronorubrum aibiense TaxID=348826 RepID=A0A5P9P3X8_9EURY|nr:hypothetical protein [Natronorubrum aibiense]QFU82861.1 hypothetical protein GCU68_10135 [Natronorubrum aibiense]